MKNVVVLFSGQGAQKVGMGQDLVAEYPVAAQMFAEADAALGWDLSKVMFEGPDEELTRTSCCQPALYLHGLACLAVLKEKLPDLNPVAVAGLSLGEFTAHSAAGSLSFADGLQLVAKRGAFMEEACEATEGSMAAMIGGDEEAVGSLAAESGVDVANFNAPGQIVVSGSVEGIDAAVAGAKAKGIRIAKKLKVAGAYHSRLMNSAQEKLMAELAETSFAEPAVPVICNYEAKSVSAADEIRRTLANQVTGSVRWTASMQSLIAEGNTLFIECGPGKVLAGLMSRTDKSVQVISVDDVASLEATVAELS